MTGKPHIKLNVPFGEDRVLLHTCCAPCSGAIIECLLDNGIRPTIFYCNPNIWPEEEYLIRRNECTRFAGQLGLDIVDDDYDHNAWLKGIESLYNGKEGLSVENLGDVGHGKLSPDRCSGSSRDGRCSGSRRDDICGEAPDVWKILSAAPERGERCLLCFKYRLLRTAMYAVEHGFRVITTTLASSRWKSLPQINEAGNWAVAQALATFKTVDGYAVGGSVEGLVWWEQNWRKGGLQERRGQLIKEYGFYNQKWCGCEFSKTSIFDTVG